MATFVDYLTTGSGAVAFRLVIEGCPFIFVTEPAMECTMDDGRVVVRGLKASGINIDESVYIAGAELNVKLGAIQIIETDGPNLDAASRAFSGFTAASMIAALAENATETDTSIAVFGAEALTASSVVHIGTEALRVGVAVGSSVPVDRGFWRTTAQAFSTSIPGVNGPSLNVVEISDQPQNYAGRRFWLYGHGTSELTLNTADDDADGFCLYRGILAANPELTDSRTWTLQTQSRMSLLDADIGKAADGGTALRGIYYPAAAPIYLAFTLRSGPNANDAITATYALYIYGFWETQSEFCAALTATLLADATLSSWTGTWEARVTTSGAWNLFYTPNTGAPKWITVEGGSAVDGTFTNTLDTFGPVVGGTQYQCGWAATVTYDRIGPLAVPGDQARTTPRGNYAQLDATIRALSGSNVPPASAYLAWPLKRFYLDFSAAVTQWGSIKITPPPPIGSTDTPASIDARAIAGGGATGYVEINDTHVMLPRFAGAGTYQPTFELTTIYGPIAGAADGCTLAEFIQAIIDDSPTTGNIGGPFLTSDDVADWTAVVNAAIAGVAGLRRRLYSFSKQRKLIDVLREEWKLHGLYPCLDSSGRIAVQPLPVSGSRTPSFTIDATIHAPGDDFGKLRLAPDGLISSIELKGGYIPADDKWQTTWNFVALGGQAATKGKGAKLSIAPIARPLTVSAVDGGDIPIADARRLVQQVLTLFGRQYYYVDVPVTMLAHGLRIGDEIIVTVRQLPYGGARAQNTPGAGMTNVRAFVIGRSWQYGDSPSGTLTLLVQARNTAGYTPAAWISSTSGSGTSWSLTVEQAHYGPQRNDASAPEDASFFATGYRIRLREWDAETPRIVLGTVVSVAGNIIAITTDSAWDPGTAQWILGFAPSTTSGIATGQKAYAFLADASGRIQWGDGTSTAPRVFA